MKIVYIGFNNTRLINHLMVSPTTTILVSDEPHNITLKDFKISDINIFPKSQSKYHK